MEKMNYSNKFLHEKTYLNNLNLSKEDSLTSKKIKEIYDNILEEYFFTQSLDQLIKIFDILEYVDKTILTDPLILKHQFNNLVIHLTKNLLKKSYKLINFTEIELLLFTKLIKYIIKINFNSSKLIRSIEKYLNKISINEYLLFNHINLKYFSKLIFIYIENQSIIHSILKCLLSNFYIESFRQLKYNKFLLIKCPTYWIKYQGEHKEEMSNRLLNRLLIPSFTILKKTYPSQFSKSINKLLDLLNICFIECTRNLLNNDDLIFLTDILLSILDNQRSIRKNIIKFLLSLINKFEIIENYLKEKLNIFYELIHQENDIYLIFACLFNQNQIEDIINKDEKFIQIIEKYIEQNNNNQNNSFIKRLEYILNLSKTKDQSKYTSRQCEIINPIKSITESNENENKEEVTLIWYDENLDTNLDTNKTIEFLQQINDYVLICSNNDICIQYINDIKREKIFVIISGSSIDSILDLIHDYKQIDSIFIFCFKLNKYEKYLNNNKYYKIIGIYNDYQLLLNSIQENIHYLIKQIEASNLFDQEEKSMKNLNKYLFEFRSFILFKQVLLKTEYNNQIAKQQMINICQNYYRNNKKELLNIQLFDQTYQSENAIYWYTKQTFVYRLVNKALRTEDYQAILMLRFFIVDLCQNLKIKYEELKEKENSKTILSYRGFKLSPPEIHNLKHNIGKIIATNGFLSTSRSKDIAFTFANKATKRLNVETVMLEINVDISNLTVILADVSQFSDFPEEEEILFDLGASFRIDSIDYDQSQKMWMVKLTAVSEDSFLQDIQKFLIENCSSKNMNILLGELFYLMEKYSTCRKYFQNLLITLYLNDQTENLPKIYYYIGQTYEIEKDYDNALHNYIKSYDHYVLLNKSEDIARITNHIGIIYFNKNDKINAKNYFKKSYEMWIEINKNDQHCEIARLMDCFGCLEDDNEKARDYFLKSLNIYENSSHICTIDNHDYYISQVSEHLAERYYHDNDYDKALEYILKTMKIREKYLSTLYGRKNYIISLMKLWKICEETHQNIWLTYQDQFIQLIDIDLINLIPELKAFLNDAIFLKRNYLEQREDDNDASNELLEHSLNSLKLILKIDPLNYEKIIQLNIDIGLVYVKTKDYHWADQHFQKALEFCEKYRPNDLKLLSIIYQSLSDMNLDKNEYDQAFYLRMKSMSMNEKTSQLTEKEQEAQSYFDIGEKLMIRNFDKALEFLNKSLEIRKSYLNNDEIILAIIYQDIGATYINKLNFDIALEYYSKAIEIFEKYFNEVKQSEFNIKLFYGKCYFDIGKIYQNKNQYEKSNEYFLKSIFIIEKNFSSSDKICFLSSCYEGIALNYYRISQYDLSISFYEKSLQFLFEHIKLFPLCDHRKDISSHLIHLSAVYIEKKDYEIAREYLEKAKDILPENHQNLANCFLFIGISYMENKQYQNAIINYQNAIKIFEIHLPINEENYALCLLNLSTCYSNMNKDFYDNGIDLILKAIHIYENKLSKIENNLAQSYWIYAFILSKKGKFDLAIQYAYKSLELRINQDTIYIPITYHLLGECFYHIFQYEKALSLLLISKDNYEKYLTNLNNEIGASILNDIGTCFIKLNNYQNALEYAIKSCEIRDEILPLIDLQKAESYSTLALIYYKLEQYEKSNEYIQKTLKLTKQLIFNGEDIENIGDVFQNIAEVYLNQKNLLKSKKYYKKALKYTKIDKFDDHPDIQHLQKIIEEIIPS